MRKTKLLIIGAGPGGYVAGIRAGQLGIETIVVEEKFLGGVCLNVGCIPTKALLHASHVYAMGREASTMGIEVSDISLNLRKLNAWKNKVVKRLVSGVEFLLKNNNVQILKGRAVFLDEHRVDVDGEIVQADHIIIATGSRPSYIPGVVPDGKDIWNSDHAVSLPKIPDSLLVIGAGAVGLEFASIYSRLGSKVVVVEIMDQIVPGSDRECANILMRALRKQGIEIKLSSKVVSVEGYSPFKVRMESGGKQEEYEFETILVATGRIPNTDALNLDKAGVEVDDRGFIKVDEQLRTSQKHIFAIGDVVGHPMLAHKASKQGIVAVEIIAGKEKLYDVRAIPSVVYTYPEFAMVGLTEEKAKELGYKVKVGKFPLTANGRALGMNMTDGIAKIVADEETDEILGVHVVSPEASSIVSEGALAIEMLATSEDIALTVHPHPTISEILMEAAENVHKRAIHIIN